MEFISVFDIFKIGIGPSSSHTMGPWRAAQRFVQGLVESGTLDKVSAVQVELYGSLAKTGKGHGTDIAVMLGLNGDDPVTIPVPDVSRNIENIHAQHKINLGGKKLIPFDPNTDIHFHFDQVLDFHANGLSFRAFFVDETCTSETYYSIGGGFVVQEGQTESDLEMDIPYPIASGADLKKYCQQTGKSIAEVVTVNELHLRSKAEIDAGLDRLWTVMKDCIYESCHKDGILPGGLNVQRRAKGMAAKMMHEKSYANVDEWIELIRTGPSSFNTTLKWLSCFALAVNEENAAFGRIVTAPTNGAAGVIPAVLMYHVCFSDSFKPKDIYEFLLTAGEIGSLFKKGATISAAMGGCQAEIGVSSAMAAAGLTAVLGGSYEQAMMAAEIAMEHHLGMTCDPIGGLVQIPCIERNTMGAIKAVTAAQIALESDPKKALVTLDAVIKTMKQTAEDMNTKYKETADGGLAVNISVGLAEC